MAVTVWKIFKNFDGQTHFLDIGSYAVLVLNQPIQIIPKYLISLWNEARLRATADGGTDRWYQFVSSLSNKSQLKQIDPDLVSGDFDSIKPETLQHCKDKGVKVVRTPDQDKTDFTKALEEIEKHSSDKIENIVAVVENGGRLDHLMSNLNTLYQVCSVKKTKLFLLDTNSLTWLLSAGCHNIHIPAPLVKAQAACGLIPLGECCIVTTTGLKWNLNKDTMMFGGLISSSNTYGEDSLGLVTVETDNPLLWTMSLDL